MTTTAINWFITASTLRAAFTENEREDGSTFWCLTDEAADDLQLWLMDLHDDELPNDWRYETIASILDALIDTDDLANVDHYELASGIANNITDIYNSDLFQWYANHPDRVKYIDQAQEEGLISEDTDTIARLSIGQNECIRSIVHRIIDSLV